MKNRTFEQYDEDSYALQARSPNYWNSFSIENISGRSFRWYSSDSRDRFEEQKRPTYGRNDVDYVFNSHGYRCDEFDGEGPSILFVGCSLTIGVGMPYSEIWPRLFTQMCEAELGRPVRYWNIGHGGKGLDYCYRSLKLSRDVIKPDYVIAYLPDGGRKELFYGDRIFDLIPACMKEHGISPKQIPGIECFMTDEDSTLSLLRTVSSIGDMIGDDRSWSWNCWSLFENTTKLFYRFGGDRFTSNKFSSVIQHTDFARDNLHPGRQCNRAFATQLFSELGERVVDKLRTTC